MGKQNRGGSARNSRRNGLRGGGRDGSRSPHTQRPRQGKSASPKGGRGAAQHRRSTSGVIEGRRAVAEALSAHVPIRRVWVQPDASEELVRLAERAVAAGAEMETVPTRELDRLSSHGAHQGIVVQTAPFEYSALGDIIRGAGTGDALIVVLDHVTDEGNFGAIVRSCEVVGAAGVVIASSRAASVGVGAYKTSAGAALRIPIAQVPNIASAVVELKEAGFWAAAATEHAELDVWDAPLEGRVALVMGSEGSGISRLVRERCDFECRLPQRGQIESLNVAQATTVLCYEWLRRETLREASSGGEA